MSAKKSKGLKGKIGVFNLPKGMTRKLYLRNMAALGALFLLALGAFIWHTASHGIYIRNYMTDGYELDSAQLQQTVGYRTAEPSAQDSKTTGYQTGNAGTPSMVYKDYVYIQDGRDYRFALTVDAVEETGIYYDDYHQPYFGVTDTQAWADQVAALPPVTYEPMQGVSSEYYIMPLERLVQITSGGFTFLAVVPYDKAVAVGDTLRGIFTQFGEYMVADYAHDLYLKGGSSGQLLCYFFDIRDVPVEFEDENWGYMVLYALITGFMLLLNLIFLIWPHFHPFFRQMLKYGTLDEVTASIDEEFAEGQRFIDSKKAYLGDKWYIQKSLFMNVVNRNPDAMPENQKAREGSINKRRYSDYAEKRTEPTEKYDPLKENMKNRYNKYY